VRPCIQGTATLRFTQRDIGDGPGGGDGGGGGGGGGPGGGSGGGIQLASHEDTVDLVGCVNTGRVKNRR